MTSQTNHETTSREPIFSVPTLVVLGTVIVVCIALATPQGGPNSEAIRWPLRRLNIALLVGHLFVLGRYCGSAVLSAIRGHATWNAAFSPMAILAGAVFLSLPAIFSWSVFAKPDVLMFVTSLSLLLASFEVLYLVVYFRNYRTRQIQRLMAQGNYQEALTLLTPQLRRNPVNHWDLITGGILYLRLGEFEEGRRLLDQAVALSNRDPVVLTYVASARHIEQRYAEGLALTDEVIARMGEQPILLLNRCTFLVELDRVAEARSIWRQLKDPAKLIPPNDRDGERVFARLCALLDEPEAEGSATRA